MKNLSIVCKIVAWKTTLLFIFGVSALKKIKIYSELVYIIAQFGLTLAVAIMAAADFGVSMIVAPAYIVSQKFTFFTFGQWDYIIQGVLFIAFCIAMKKFKFTYFVSFITCVIYGTILDMWRAVIPVLNPDVTAPGSMDLWVRIVMFVVGELLTAFTVMLFFKTYIYPQVCDLFVKGIVAKYGFDQTKCKRIFDLCCFMLSLILTLVLFRGFVGIKWGTVIITLVNGVLIGACSKLYDKFFETVPLFPRLAEKFKF